MFFFVYCALHNPNNDKTPMKQIILTCLLVLLIASNFNLSAQDKFQIYKNLISQYGNIESVTVDAKSEGSWVLTTIKAKRGNKFNITMGDLHIVSDGKTVWNYNSSRKVVVVSNYDDVCDEGGFTSISLDNFFFNVLQKLQPISLSSVLNTKNGKQNLLKLQNEDPAQDIQQVNLYLDSSFKTIQDIEIITSSVTQKFQVSKLSINKKISDGIFTFKSPKDVEVVDMR